ncbi:MAG TPA: DoxX family protein [Bacteroidaceae bacterium]|nr:DoxX family protein [Bacteroidaceae bacterium]
MEKIKNGNILDRNVDLGLLLLRVPLGIMMLLHGVAKLMGGLGFIKEILFKEGFPEFLAYGVVVGEVLAPIAIIIGFKTRVASAIFAFNCFAAAWLVHSHQFISLNETGGWAVELLGLYFFGALALVFTGGGQYSLSRNSLFD